MKHELVDWLCIGVVCGCEFESWLANDSPFSFTFFFFAKVEKP